MPDLITERGQGTLMIKRVIFWLFLYMYTLFRTALSDPLRLRMLGSNPGHWHWQTYALTTRLDLIPIMCIFFGRLECVGHSFAYVAHYIFMRNVRIRTQRAAATFFQKTVFFSKIFFGKPPSKFLEECLILEYKWKWSPVYNFNSAKALKKLLSAGVEVTSIFPNSDTQKDLLM